MRVHVDTDFGGDPDDACALAMLLGWPDVDLVGITTNLDIEGRRAGCVAHCLDLAGRDDVAVAAGAEASLSTLTRHASAWADARYWPDPVPPRPSPPGRALELLADSAASGATIVALGAHTNLALLAICRPGILDGVRVVAMGGWLEPPAPGFPRWGPKSDWNVQCDTQATQILLATEADLTLAVVPVTMKAQLRSARLPRLRAAGPLGALLAAQAQTYATDRDMAALGCRHPGLADDLVNFHHDPVACAVAVGWAGLTLEPKRLATHLHDGLLRFRESTDGRDTKVLVDVDARAFEQTWLTSVEAVSAHG